MKNRYILLVLTALTVGITSCKKGESSAPIGGKWQEIKIRLYALDTADRILYDTTYLAPFTNLDYVQFNVGGTITTSTDHYYYPNNYGYHITAQAIPQSIGTLGYTNIGGGRYVLSNISQLETPGGFYVTDTAFVTGNTLRIHVVNYGHGTGGDQGITDSYYDR